ncbi:MAG TPA: hypothetical protein VE080_00800, partial [Candidatus Aquicultoraceae bacterium]|nr:hypothetical protein [Candidatus Aquicultoraceae bacterium]
MTKNILTGAAREAVRLAAVHVDFATVRDHAVTRAQEVLNSAGIRGASVSVQENNVGEPTVMIEVSCDFPIIVGGFFELSGTGPNGTIPLTS